MSQNSRIWEFDNAKVLPIWDDQNRIKSATWIVSDTEPPTYKGIIELDSPQKVACCKKMFNASWIKGNKDRKIQFTDNPVHFRYEPMKVEASNPMHNNALIEMIKSMQGELTNLRKEISKIRKLQQNITQPLITRSLSKPLEPRIMAIFL